LHDNGFGNPVPSKGLAKGRFLFTRSGRPLLKQKKNMGNEPVSQGNFT